MNRIIIVFCVTLFLSGCTMYRITSENTSPEFYPPKNSIEEVEYVEEVTLPHQVIGVVSVTTERRQTVKDVLDKMRREAAILGGDAITDIQTDAAGEWKKFKVLENAYIRASFTAKVIVYQ